MQEKCTLALFEFEPVERKKIDADLSTLVVRTADAEEGMAAFVEKRTPEFRDA
jgi:enoyl-CoA hydratase